MPIRDIERQIVYYHAHKKFYDKEWKSKNRDKWNKYQAEYKRNKRRLKTTLRISEILGLSYSD